MFMVVWVMVCFGELCSGCMIMYIEFVNVFVLKVVVSIVVVFGLLNLCIVDEVIVRIGIVLIVIVVIDVYSVICCSGLLVSSVLMFCQMGGGVLVFLFVVMGDCIGGRVVSVIVVMSVILLIVSILIIGLVEVVMSVISIGLRVVVILYVNVFSFCVWCCCDCLLFIIMLRWLFRLLVSRGLQLLVIMSVVMFSVSYLWVKDMVVILMVSVYRMNVVVRMVCGCVEWFRMGVMRGLVRWGVVSVVVRILVVEVLEGDEFVRSMNLMMVFVFVFCMSVVDVVYVLIVCFVLFMLILFVFVIG